MRFSRLRLNGFKSFVDPTDVLIAEGLTGVVGPNGCGKSNLLEALRWVMGETRPTAMRGDGMENVIFAGAASRPARHFAEVALTIDNTERLAPAGFNEADLIEIVRRITRDAGSAYKANTRDVRARDVQMLFADASTGSHSPALVRQGQISELINARPQARRRILEEAAGISGLYARRHEAELKLNAAEANLARVDDVVEQLAAQLGALGRQARQAARYRDIGAALRRAEGLLLVRRWRDADSAREAAEAALRERMTAAATAERRAREAVAAREAAAAALPPLRDEETVAAAVLQRLVAERAALDAQEAEAGREAAALEARIAQLGADLAREAALDRDAVNTLARLEREAAELRAAEENHPAALAAAAEAARTAAEALAEREAALSELTEDAARLAARHGSAERLAQDAGRTLARAESEAAKSQAAVAAAEAALARATRAEAATVEAEVVATAMTAEAEATLTAADLARGEAQVAEAEARAARSAAEGEAGALRAEVAALARLAEGGTGGAGQVLDAVRVSPGYERALGAAFADEARAPAVESDAPTGWAALPPYEVEAPLPAGTEPLAGHVDVPAVLRRRIEQVGLVEPGDGLRLQPVLLPGQRLVSRAGDLWRWDGFRAAAADAPSAAALRLEQRNRLERLRNELAVGEAAAEATAGEHDALRRRLQDLTDADRAAREARRKADGHATEAIRAASRAAAERNLAAGRLEALMLAVARHAEEATAARARLAEAEAALAELGDLAAAREALDAVRLTVEAARVTTLSRRAAHEELRRAGEARAGRLRKVAAEAASWRERSATAGTRIAELTRRREAAEAERAAAAAIPAGIAERRRELEALLRAAEERRRAASDALAGGEVAAREAAEAERGSERDAGAAREARAAAEARADAAREAVALAAGRIADERETTPPGLLRALGIDPDVAPVAEELEDEVQRLKRAREALGAVNLRAEEDARAVEAEHGALVAEKADLDGAIRTLRGGIAGLNREGRERLLTAFEQVNANFATLFTGLFGGGEARLELVESDDPLEAGLEILCQPPGKKLATLSLLSGGEQTLTALALIFAVFLANPAPICVLDEVDAPLDDANVTRFCDLLDDMTRRTDTRFLIITHHAVTMARMDRLYGVTMSEPGVSQLVSVDLRRAEQLVA